MKPKIPTTTSKPVVVSDKDFPWEKSPAQEFLTFEKLQKMKLEDLKVIGLLYKVINEETEEEQQISLDGSPTLTTLRQLLDEAEKDYGIDPDKCSVSLNYNNSEMFLHYSLPFDLKCVPSYELDKIRGKIIEKQKVWQQKYINYLELKKEFNDK